LTDLPARHRAKVRQAVERLELFGPRLGFPDSSAVKGTPFRELRTRFAGQQYRVLYLQDGDAFVLFVGFHKTSDRDLERAVREGGEALGRLPIRAELARRPCPPDH
jgi:hypothetical protein